MKKEEKKEELESTFPKKWAKVIEKMPEFKDIADAASVEDLKKIIVTCEGNIYNVNVDMSKDEKLNAALELVKEFRSSYNEAKKFQNAKIQYSLYLLEQKGTELGDSK